MMKKIIRKLQQVCLIMIGMTLYLPMIKAQSVGNDTGDFMRSTGHIYVVVAVIVLIFLGLGFTLLMLDRRLTNLEHNKNHHTNVR